MNIKINPKTIKIAMICCIESNESYSFKYLIIIQKKFFYLIRKKSMQI